MSHRIPHYHSLPLSNSPADYHITNNISSNWRHLQGIVCPRRNYSKNADVKRKRDAKRNFLQKFAERKSVACSFKNIQKMGEKIELTKELAIDCEFVRGLAGEREISLLARVSIVNANGKCIMDKFVKPTQKVVNYCTFVSGIRPCDLINADPFDKVQCEVAKIIDGRILVGHALDNDLLEFIGKKTSVENIG